MQQGQQLNQESLAQIRGDWYKAYFAADLDYLLKVEAKGFTYISVLGIEDTCQRYKLIQERVDSDSWFPSEAHREDLSASYQFLDSHCYVTGEGRIHTNANTAHNRYFSEVWSFGDSGWQILSLHASVVPA